MRCLPYCLTVPFARRWAVGLVRPAAIVACVLAAILLNGVAQADTPSPSPNASPKPDADAAKLGRSTAVA